MEEKSELIVAFVQPGALAPSKPRSYKDASDILPRLPTSLGAIGGVRVPRALKAGVSGILAHSGNLHSKRAAAISLTPRSPRVPESHSFLSL